MPETSSYVTTIRSRRLNGEADVPAPVLRDMKIGYLEAALQNQTQRGMRWLEDDIRLRNDTLRRGKAVQQPIVSHVSRAKQKGKKNGSRKMVASISAGHEKARAKNRAHATQRGRIGAVRASARTARRKGKKR